MSNGSGRDIFTQGYTGETTLIRGETQLEDMTSRNVLEKKIIHKLIGATPNVLNGTIFEADDDIVVTDFAKGSPGQRIHILGNGSKEIDVNGGFIKTNIGANKILQSEVVYTFTFFPIPGPPKSHVWIEDN